jgi:hypothetical protein
VKVVSDMYLYQKRDRLMKEERTSIGIDMYIALSCSIVKIERYEESKREHFNSNWIFVFGKPIDQRQRKSGDSSLFNLEYLSSTDLV